MHVRILLQLAVALLLCGTGGANAHATLVLGEFEVIPETPGAGSPFTLQVSLMDPTQVPVEDAVVFAELRPVGAPEAEPVRAEFTETETAGRYESRTELPRAVAYSVLLRDQTYRQEEATAQLETPLRVGEANAAQGFVFPPTAIGAAGWRTWLLWLVGLPVVAALLVTVLVLTRGDAPDPARGTRTQDG
jgi:hypothetical protein